MYTCTKCGNARLQFVVEGFSITVMPRTQTSKRVRELMKEKLGKDVKPFGELNDFTLKAAGKPEIVSAICTNCGFKGPLSVFKEEERCTCGSAETPTFCEKFKVIVCSKCAEGYYCLGCTHVCPLAKPGVEAPYKKLVDFDMFIQEFKRERE